MYKTMCRFTNLHRVNQKRRAKKKRKKRIVTFLCFLICSLVCFCRCAIVFSLSPVLPVLSRFDHIYRLNEYAMANKTSYDSTTHKGTHLPAYDGPRTCACVRVKAFSRVIACYSLAHISTFDGIRWKITNITFKSIDPSIKHWCAMT